MRLFMSVISLYVISLAAYALPPYGSSGEPRGVAQLQMQDIDDNLVLMISTRDGEFFDFSMASAGNVSIECDRDGDLLTTNAVLRIDGNTEADYYYAMLLSALTSGSKVELRYNECMESFGSSWPIVYAVVMHSPVD
jgi:hypothetical protein